MQQGDRVLIVGSHPWAGNAGEYLKTESLKLLPGKVGHRVRLDNGMECFVIEERHWRKVVD